MLIFGIALIGTWLCLSNFLPSQMRDNFSFLLPERTLNLGLDLRGGSHLLLEVDVATITRERLETVLSDVRLSLRKERIKYSHLRIEGESVRVKILNSQQKAKALSVLQDIVRPTQLNIFSGGSNVDLIIEDEPGNIIRLALSKASLIERNNKAVQQSIEIIRRRIDELGTTEPSIQRQGERRVLVQVPGLDNPARLKDLLGRTAKLNFHLVDPSEADVLAGAIIPAGSRWIPSEDGNQRLIRKRVMISGDKLVDAQTGFDERTGEPAVFFRFDTSGGRKFGEVTRINVGRPFAIILDGKVISAPVIQSPILGGSGQITGNFTVESANDLAILLRAGALPAPLSVLEERTVGPGLGADSIAAGKIAVQVGFAAVIIFITLAYGLFGIFANIALIINVALILGVLSLLQATLTLPGIAGIVLTIGMAVDANVLIFERIREEARAGKNALLAIEAGYMRARNTILDANITTLIAAIILFQLGSGPIRGFAVTLGIGIITSLFTAFTLTRVFVALWAKRNRNALLPM